MEIDRAQKVYLSCNVQKEPENSDTRIPEKFCKELKRELRYNGVFSEVTTNKEDNVAYHIVSRIQEYDKGSANKRLYLGFGAGRSKFNVNVDLIDSQDNNLICTIKSDNQSPATPGLAGLDLGYSATIDIYYLMKNSAKEITKKISSLQ